MQSKGKARPPSEHFTPMPNDIIEALYHHRITGEQYRIIHLIARQSWGYVNSLSGNPGTRREAVNFAGDYIAKSLGRNVRDVNRDLQTLIQRHIIKVVEDHDHSKSRALAINRNVSEWIAISWRPARTKPHFNEPMLGDHGSSLRRSDAQLGPNRKQAEFAGSSKMVIETQSK